MAVSPTIVAIFIGSTVVALSALGWPRVYGSKPVGVGTTAIAAVIGVLVVFALEQAGLFGRALADGSALPLTIAAMVALPIAAVVSVLSLRRRRSAPKR